jgi:hypothetical protein
VSSPQASAVTSVLRERLVRLRPSERVGAVLVWAAGVVVFFRASFRSGFDQIIGNSGDARLIAVLHEHWLKVARGESSWRSPNFFYPHRGTLGYSDTFVLDAPLYIPLRAAGFDMYAAMQWTYILLNGIGFAGTFILCKKKVHLGFWVSVGFAAIFAWSNSLYIKAGHPQLYSVYWAPWLIIASLAAVRAIHRRNRILLGFGTGLFMALLTYSTFYIGWFSLLAAGVSAIFVGSVRTLTIGAKATLLETRSFALPIVGAVAGLAVGLIPFAATYLPVLDEQGGRSYDSAMLYALRPGDLINVGRSNWLWGPALGEIFSDSPRLTDVERSLALTPMLLGAMMVATIMLVVRRRRMKSLGGDAALGLVLATWALMLLPVKFGFGSLWAIPWHTVPGAVAIRAIGRLQIVTLFVGCLSLALAAKVLRSPRAQVPQAAGIGLRRLVPLALMSLLLGEQLNRDRNSIVDRSEELQLFAAVPSPPPSCVAFFIVGEATLQAPFFQSNIDAMIIAQRLDIPTINGYSGQFPPGWWLDPSSADYIATVRAWVAARGIDVSTLCTYDSSSQRWSEAALSGS